MIHNCHHPHLLDWLRHHHNIGIRQFFIYDNESDEPIAEAVKCLPFADSIHVMPSPGWQKNDQIDRYRECAAAIASGDFPHCDWLAFIDDDEYLMCDGNLADVLRDFPESGVAMSWKVFGSSGMETRTDAPRVDRFTAGSGIDFDLNRHHKTIARPEMIVQFHDTHSCIYKDGYCVDVLHMPTHNAFSEPVHSVLWVNHYFTGSREEFQEKMESRNRRGRPAGNIQPEWFDIVNKACAALLLLSTAFLTACSTPASVTVGDVTVKTSGRVGGKGGMVVQRGNLEIRTWDNNEDSFREFGKTARFVTGAVQLAAVAKSGISAVSSIKNTKTAADASTAAAQESTKQAVIAAEREAARMAAEEAAAEALVLPPVPIIP